jgi:replicative superfamily II helicase
MELEELPEFMRSYYLYHTQVTKLRDWQRCVLNSAEWRVGMNYLFVVGTSGGKTLVLEAAAARMFSCSSRRKAIFIFPYIELANEKHVELAQIFDRHQVKGLYGSADEDLSFEEIAVCTPEKAYQMATQPSFSVDLVLFDEVHLINDSSRGHVVESLIHILMACHRRTRIIATTATLSREDAVALSTTMRAHLYYVEAAQQRHNISILYNNTLRQTFNGVTSEYRVDESFVLSRMTTNFELGTSFMAFCIVIKTAEAEAANFTQHLINTGHLFTPPGTCDWDTDIQYLRENGYGVLAGCMECGVVYHHSLLMPEVKSIIGK